MRPRLISIAVILSFVLFCSGCAHQPPQLDVCPSTSSKDYQFDAENKGRTYNDRQDSSQCTGTDSKPQRDYRHDSDRELGRLLGAIAYTVIEVVIRGIVYGLAHH